MVQLTVEIGFGADTKLFKVENVTIEKSWKFLADTAKITLPRRAFPDGDIRNFKSAEGTPILFVGAAVTIRLGYDFDFETEFVGFISKINTGTPLVIECEDGMWQLKQNNIKRSYSKITLNDLLTDILPEGVQFSTSGTIQLGKFYIDSVSVYQVLNKISEDYGLYSYFREDKLFVDFAYENPEFERKDLNLRTNVASIQRLVYLNKDDISIKVRAISFQSDGSKLETIVGDENGELHTLHFAIGLSESDLQKQAEEKMLEFRFDGYEGEILCFGQPFLEHGDIATLRDDQYPERESGYRVDTVKVDFGMGGYRRTLSLGRLADSL